MRDLGGAGDILDRDVRAVREELEMTMRVDDATVDTVPCGFVSLTLAIGFSRNIGCLCEFDGHYEAFAIIRLKRQAIVSEV